MKNKLKKYCQIWWLMSRNSFLSVLTLKAGAAVFLLAKLLRFAFFIFFLLFLLKGTKSLAGYSLNQTVFFFLTFNLVDVTSQFFFREVYRFRPLIVSGEFDLVLVKPVSALFRSLMGGADIIDLITIPPLVIALIFVAKTLNPSWLHIAFFLLLLINSFLIATAFHIAVLGLAIITLEIDHTIMIYRDMVNLGRFPIDIYKQPIQGILTYLIPVGIMITFPAKALLGIMSFWGIFSSLVLGTVAIIVSLKFWNYALTKYSSASS